MNTAAHTPGPWVIQDRHFVVAGAWPLGATICEVENNPADKISQANARLIAAAPDMLAVLKELWAQPRVVSQGERPSEDWLMRAHAAIAKAEAEARS